MAVVMALMVPGRRQEISNFALPGLFNLLFVGVAFVLYGLAVASSQRYPRWLGWAVAVAGAGGLTAGLVQAYTGESTPVTVAMGIVSRPSSPSGWW